MIEEDDSRRRLPRRTPRDTVQVTDAMTGEPVGVIGNLSSSGMLLVAHVPMVEDAIYQLRFGLPQADGRMAELELGAHLLWIDAAAGGQGAQWCGLRFIAVPASAARALRAWTQQHPGD